MITIIHSGNAAEFGGPDYKNRIWSHKWSLSKRWNSTDGVSVDSYFITSALWGSRGTAMARIGGIAHEVGSE